MITLLKFILKNINISLILFYNIIFPIVLYFILLIFFNNRIGDTHVSVTLAIGTILFYSLNISLAIILQKIKKLSDKIDKLIENK